MDTIKFVIEQYTDEDFDCALPIINIYINERDLIDLVSEVEHKLFIAGGEKSPAQVTLDMKSNTSKGFTMKCWAGKPIPAVSC